MEQYGSGNTDGQDHGRFMAQDAFKECEYCGERILVRDTRCKYCGSLLGTLIHNSSGYLQYRPVNTQAYPQNISQSQYGPQAQYQPQAQYRPQAQYQPQSQYIPKSKDSWRQRDQQAWQYPPQYMQDGQIPHQYAPVGCQTPSQYPPSVYQPQPAMQEAMQDKNEENSSAVNQDEENKNTSKADAYEAIEMDATKPDAPDQETAKQETATEEKSKEETPKHETAKQETAKQEAESSFGCTTPKLGNGLKVLMTVLFTVIPCIGQLVGVIAGILFMGYDEDPDRQSFGKALLVSSIIMFAVSCLFVFVIVVILAANGSVFFDF